MDIHFLLLKEHYRLQKNTLPPTDDYFFMLGMIADFQTKNLFSKKAMIQFN